MFRHHHSTGESKHSRKYMVAVHVFFGLLFGIALALVFGFAVMWLWNHILPSLLGVRNITYWQSVGLLVLTRLLFGGHGRHIQRDRMRGRLGHGEAARRYDKWWREVGEQSFRDFVNKPNPQQS